MKIQPPQPPIQVSKWLKTQVLLDSDEMESLLSSLGSFKIYITSRITSENDHEVSVQQFLSSYTEYVNVLKQGQEPQNASYKDLFSTVFSVTPDLLYAIPIAQNQQLIRADKPVIQLQAHHINYSHADQKIYSMSFGSETISWGIQFAYPQLYKNPSDHQVHKVDNSPQFPNTQLFINLQKWVRNHTIPTPFLVNSQKVNMPVRLGKKCLVWINNHQQLKNHKIQVAVGVAEVSILRPTA